jgi:hypothetical protein
VTWCLSTEPAGPARPPAGRGGRCRPSARRPCPKPGLVSVDRDSRGRRLSRLTETVA